MFSEYTPKCNLNLSMGRLRPFFFQFSGKSLLLDRIMCLSYTQNLTVDVKCKKRILFTYLRKVWLPLCRILRNSSHIINYVGISCTEFDSIVQKLQKMGEKFYLRPYGKSSFPYTYCQKSLNRSVKLRRDIPIHLYLFRRRMGVIRVEVTLCPSVKYDCHCADFHDTQSFSRNLCKESDVPYFMKI